MNISQWIILVFIDEIVVCALMRIETIVYEVCNALGL